MSEPKRALISGKIIGKRTLKDELENIVEKDEIEKFLYDFCIYKIPSDSLIPSTIIYLNDKESFELFIEECKSIHKMAIYFLNENQKIYIANDKKKNYIINIKALEIADVKLLLENENITKYALNSFSFIKWCSQNNIKITNLYDIPTYIKLLTNDVDPFKDINTYLAEYTSSMPDYEYPEQSYLTISNFILKLGEYLSSFANIFNLEQVAKLINENAIYESSDEYINFAGETVIKIRYTDLLDTLAEVRETVKNDFLMKSYIVSPLNIIAPKYNQNIDSLINDIYFNDLMIVICNELYRQNTPVKFDYHSQEFVIKCDTQNIGELVNKLKEIFQETFKAIFNKNSTLYIEIKTI